MADKREGASETAVQKQMKTKLEEMWKELQSNLPSVNFDTDDRDERNRDNDDDDDIVEDNYDFVEDLDEPKSKLDSDDEEKFIKFLNNDKAMRQHSPGDEVDYQGKLTPSAVFLNDDDDNDVVMTSASSLLLTEFAREFLSMRKGEKSVEAAGNVSHVTAEAAKITKNIFDQTNSKLSMEIFESINIDKLLESVKSKQKGSNNAERTPVDDSMRNEASAGLSPRYLSEDEKVMKKLAEMSMQISRNDSETTLDLKTGAFIKPDGRPSQARLKIPAVESKTGATTQTVAADLTNADEDLDRRITNDLNKFLKQHNITDGNLVETRRLDLRASQTCAEPAPFRHIYSKPTIESLLENIVLKEDDDHLFRNLKPGAKLRYLNEDENESSSSDDNDEVSSGNGLWIERFRQQKATGAKSS